MKRQSLRDKEFTKKIKDQAWEKSEEQCEFCGDGITRQTCQFHHRNPKFKGGQDNLDNCIVLCPDCHSSTLGYMIFHGRDASSKNIFKGGRSEKKLRRQVYYTRMNAIKKLLRLIPASFDFTKLEKK